MNPTLRSPALTHERPFGMHSLPSAFSMMGRRPALSHSSPDFLSQDPMLGSQPSLSPSSHLHSGISSATGATPWSWMPPHPHIASPDFFQTHLSSGWLGHDHDRARERIDDCLFTSPRSHAPPLINGAGSTPSFNPGSGIFYPHATNSAPPAHSFPHHGSSWSNHSNHGQRPSYDHGDNHDDIFSIPMRPRLTSINSDDGSKNLLNKHTELPTYLHMPDRRLDHQKETYHDRAISESTGTLSTSHYQDKTQQPLQPSPIVKSTNTSKSSAISKPIKDFTHYEQPKSIEKKPEELMRPAAPIISPTYVQPIKTEKNPTTDGSAFSLPPSSQDVKILPPPPKLTKTKAQPPPRLQVPKSILNDREAVSPQVSPKNTEQNKTINESIPPKQNMTNSSVKKASLSSSEPTKLSASKEALLQKLKERPILQQTQTEAKKPKATQEVSKPPPSKPSPTKPLPAKPQMSKPATKPSITSPPKIPSGKPLQMARFRLPYNNEDTSDEESDSSEASTGSGTASDGTEEGEGKEGEESGSGTESESDSDGSDNEEDAGEDDDEEDDDEDESSMNIGSHDDSHSDSLYVHQGMSMAASGNYLWV